MIPKFAILLVAAGGAAGAVCRFLLSNYITHQTENIFPWGTLSVNMLGCFLIGIIWALAEFTQLISPQLRALLLVGFLGGFTTFSSFALESFNLIKIPAAELMLLNMLLQNVLGLVLVALGYYATQGLLHLIR